VPAGLHLSSVHRREDTLVNALGLPFARGVNVVRAELSPWSTLTRGVTMHPNVACPCTKTWCHKY
jgi:hypothetical protein